MQPRQSDRCTYGVFEDGDDIISFWKPQTHYQGWIDTMHGGILCTLIDEIAGWVIFRKLQTSGMTTHLEIRYKKPVMTTEPQITLRAHIAEQRRNLVTIEVTLENSKGEICTEGKATYFAFNKEKQKKWDSLHVNLKAKSFCPCNLFSATKYKLNCLDIARTLKLTTEHLKGLCFSHILPKMGETIYSPSDRTSENCHTHNRCRRRKSRYQSARFNSAPRNNISPLSATYLHLHITFSMP